MEKYINIYLGNYHFISKMEENYNIYEVVKITSHKIIPFGGVFFKIIWVDYSSSWEPLKNLLHCDQALEDYYKELDLIGSSNFLRKLVDIIRKK